MMKKLNSKRLTVILGLLALIINFGYIYLTHRLIVEQRAYIEVLEQIIDDYIGEVEVNDEYLENEYEELEVCTENTFKSYMPYRSITAKSSKQYQLQKIAFTEEKYGLRKVDDYFMIAMTNHYGEVGDLLKISFENKTIYAIIGDIKGEGHNDCQSLNDGSMIEFIVDNKKLDSEIRYHGNLNFIFQGKIERILHLGKYE